MEKIELKPCPFCGGKSDIRYETFCVDSSYRVECLKCHARATLYLANPSHCTNAEAIRKAVEAWNRRVEDAEIH